MDADEKDERYAEERRWLMAKLEELARYEARRLTGLGLPSADAYATVYECFGEVTDEWARTGTGVIRRMTVDRPSPVCLRCGCASALRDERGNFVCTRCGAVRR